jgi:GT2 family glycosyltransferase
VLVDNGSTDGSVALVGQRFPRVRIVRIERNLGFAAGNNRGAAHARGELLAFLNNDTQADPGWLAALIAASAGARDIGLVTSRIVYMDEPERLDSAGDGLTRAGGAFKHGHGQAAAGYAAGREVFGACGAAFLIPKKIFDEVGGFDEDFFTTHEDVDLSYRVRLLGYRCVYAPGALVRHVGSATLGLASHTAVYYGQRNLEWVYLKNTPFRLLLLSLPLHLMYIVAAAGYFASIGRLPSFAAAKWAALRRLPAMIRKRRAIQRARRVSDESIWRQLEPGWVALKIREKRFERSQRSKAPGC